MAANIHVVPRGAGWALRPEGQHDDWSFHLNQAEALREAVDYAARNHVEVFRYSHSGEVMETESAWSEAALVSS